MMRRMDVAPGTVVPPLGQVSTEEKRHLYWAVTSFSFPKTAERLILPRQWVAASALFRELENDPDPARIAELHKRRTEFDAAPTLEKCVGEAVYEHVRQRVLPSAPSRLECLFAALDIFGAIEFSQVYLPPPTFNTSGMSEGGATPVSTADGNWVAADMRLFEIPTNLGSDPPLNAQAIRETETLANRYWRGEQSSDLFVEILAERLWQYTAFITEDGLPPPLCRVATHSDGELPTR